MWVVERGNPAPFADWRGPLGCLLLHGFPGTPAEMRPLGQYLAERDITVLAPLLPGHGTVPEDLRGVSWREWVATAEAGLEELRASCSSVFLGGLSLGGALALYLASRRPVSGVVALAPAIRIRDRRFEYAHILSRLRAWIEPDDGPDDLADPRARTRTWHYQRYPASAVRQVLSLVRATRQGLPRVRCPVLIVQSPRDGVLDPVGARWAYQQIPVADKVLVWLEHSGHNIAVDAEREDVFAQVYGFIGRATDPVSEE